MTQAEAELIVREIRSQCLHSSWSDLVDFWKEVIGNLETAYRAVVQSTAPLRRIASRDSNDVQAIVRDKLAMALSQLAGARQVDRWEAEATEAIKSPPTIKGEITESE